MNAPSMDPAIQAALEATLGHPAPFAPEECASIQGPLVVRGARVLDALALLPALRHLELVSCEVRKLDVLSQLPALSTLRVVCSAVSRLDALAQCANLEDLELLFTNAEDMTPLLRHPSLRRVRLMGNPWSPTSHQTQRRDLYTTPVARWGRPPLTEISHGGGWALTRQWRGKGLKLAIDYSDPRFRVLAMPGLARFEGSDCNCIRLGGDVPVLDKIDAKGAKADVLMDEFSRVLPLVSSSELQGPLQLGDADAARQWLEALSAEDKARFARFLRRFPWLTFFRQGTAPLEDTAREHQVTLPDWLKAWSEALAGFNPHCRIAVQFDGFDQGPYNEEKLLQGWYRLGRQGYASEEERGLVHDRLGLFPIGHWDDESVSALAISVASPQDRAIYQYPLGYLWDDLSDGKRLEDQLTPVFESYASMWSHVTAIRLDDLEPVPALDVSD
ncbi:hypothetical protein LY474_22235 [Myxococcus stipitatus]|uniref:hypothetical protein n=1 Tax=Myxococcus stipitatus TaxID=83455 RepID=UPI001F3292A9|nr:hypothetical protein [Myxococcus stipitatus]MCE9670527.1 hypothetical protein [Myxococcus stipitatus]